MSWAQAKEAKFRPNMKKYAEHAAWSSVGTELLHLRKYNEPGIGLQEAVERLKDAEWRARNCQTSDDHQALAELKKPLQHFLNRVEDERRKAAADQRREG